MELRFYQIDAFTDTLFKGNPACVVPLERWLPDAILFKIAQENAVPETAFFVEEEASFHLRWFTPDIEMDLCGHATLATAHCLKTLLKDSRPHYLFKTKSGLLRVKARGNAYQMELPARMPVTASLPDAIKKALSIAPQAIYKARDYVLVYKNEQEILDLQINRAQLDQINLDPGGVVVTAEGDRCDFVSRFFTPQATILEDPVTGSAHCSLVPFWAEQLQKNELNAQQCSQRGGLLNCSLVGDKVVLVGKARTYAVGTLWTE
jgi:PhzF family phenazine biosynthesis protein